MRGRPDFYLYRGEGNQDVLAVLRACRKIGSVEHFGKTVLLVEIEPRIEPLALPKGLSTGVIGLSQHGGKPLDSLAPGDVASALVWEVYELAGGKLGVAIEPGFGRATIYKIRPALDSMGRVIPPPAAAKSIVGNIIRALEADEGKTRE